MSDVMGDRIALLARMYEAFNSKDLDALMAGTHPDVVWPDFIAGGVIRTREALRDYWARQFAMVDPEASPIEYFPLSDDRVRVKIHYVIRSATGGVWTDEIRTNTFHFRDGLVVGMEWDKRG